MRKIRVLVVDDSAVVRQVLQTELNKFPDIEVVATAADPYIARDRLLAHQIDVMTLDVEMPRMDGLTFLRKVMRYRPLPTIVVSSLTAQGSAMALDALEAGAVDVLCKPGASYSVGDISAMLAEQIRAAAMVDVRAMRMRRGTPQPDPLPEFTALRKTTQQIFAIGASTGGTQAIERILVRLPRNSPPVVIAQHMPESFTKAFAERLNKLCHIAVREAVDGDHLIPGLALIAPGNWHMRVVRSGAVYLVRLDQGPRVHYQRPAVDVLFESLALSAGANVVAAILTGMGKDGAEGLLKIRRAGGRTVGQDKESCVVYGMPAEAFRIGAVEFQLPLDDIPARVLDLMASAIL